MGLFTSETIFTFEPLTYFTQARHVITIATKLKYHAKINKHI